MIETMVVDRIAAHAIRVGHSALFWSLGKLRERLAHCNCPVELDFPAREECWPSLLERADEITDCVCASGAKVLSVHAPPVKMDGDGFVETALQLARLADSLGASSVTFHPSKCGKAEDRESRQARAVANIRSAQARTKIALAVETLAHNRCLLSGDEIVEHGLPMVLDTTHVGWEKSGRLLARYADRIVTIHLSERTPEAHHQPVTERALEFVDHLRAAGWLGNVILEYWPWRWQLYDRDVALIRKRLA